MDDNNVAFSILSARAAARYSTDIASFAEANPSRIVAAVSLKLSGMDTDEGFLSGLAQQLADGRFKAVAEMLLFHAEKFDAQGNSVAPEFMVDPSAPTVQAVVDAGARLGCPIFLHIEFQSLESQYGAGERTRYMNELKQLLTAHPDQQFVLTHVAELDPGECRGLVDGYGNIFFTTNFMDLIVLMTGQPVSDYSEEQWNALFEDHPDRFVFAFDRVFERQWQTYTADMGYARGHLKKLSASVGRAIAHDNAMRLWTLGD